MNETEVIEFANTQLTLPDKLDPADEMSWQHYLYSKLGKVEVSEEIIEKPVTGPTEKLKTREEIIQETVERIVAMAKVLYGLHMVSPFMLQISCDFFFCNNLNNTLILLFL